MTLPISSTAGYGTVTGRVVTALADTADAGSLPDMGVPIGLVRFTPSIPYIRKPGSDADGGPAIILPDAISCPINATGYLTNPGNPSETSVKLLATDNPATAPINWEYIVEFQLNTGTRIPTQRIQVPGNTTRDLAVVIATASEPLVSVSTAISLATSANDLAQDAYDLALAGGGGGGGGGFTYEQIRDELGVNAFVAGTGINIDPNDTTDKITWAVTGGLSQIVGLTPTDGDIIQRVSGSWLNRTIAQLKTALTLTKTDVGLANVDNVSNAAAPVSTAQATAIAAKLDKAGGTMTGFILLNADPTSALHPATRQWVLTQVSASNDAFQVVYASGAWPARPDVTHPYTYISTSSSTAATPSDMRGGDMWIPHPDALAAA